MDSTIVIKVKHAKTLRRFNARVVNNGLELNFDGLKNKIRDLFNLSADADLILTYVDEDDDKITLGGDDDLRDVVVIQRLNPLRISVSLRIDNVARTPTSECAIFARTLNERESVMTPRSPAVVNPFSSSGKTSAGAQEAGKTSEPEHLSNEKQENTSSKPLASIADSKPVAITEAHSAPKSQVSEANKVVKSGGSKESAVSPPGHKSSDKEAQVTKPKEVEVLSPSMPNSTVPPVSKPAIGNNPGGPYSRSYGYIDGPGTIFHRGICCDGCGAHPIIGTRFKSVVKDDYDLCSICFSQMGIESDHYMRIDRPGTYHHPSPFVQQPRYHAPQMSTWDSYSMRPKLDSRFIQDVTILDGALMAPSTPFTKIWRMRNNGSLQWPCGTQLVWIGGDKMGDVLSADLQIPGGLGFPVEQELDVSVDFIAPTRPGRYISYWRMRSPSGQKFGQRVWALIQVDATTLTSVQQPLQDFNLNNMPSNAQGGSQAEVSVEDNTADLVKPVMDLTLQEKDDSAFPTNDSLLVGGGSGVSTAPSSSASPRVSYPTIGLSEPFIRLSELPFTAPPSASESDALAPVTAPALPVAADNIEQTVQVEGEEEIELEKALLMELDRMGFKEVDLNKEVLRSNNYDFDKSLNELCGVSELDHMLEELHAMGFHDDVMNKKLLEKNNGSVTQVVLDLLVEEEQ